MSFDKEIRFENVSYMYEGKTINALSQINLVIPKGKVLAVLGTTGSGKTTLVQLLLRMMDVSEGAITVDGVNVKQLNMRDFKSRIGYAPQDVFMFSDTIANNINFGMNPTTINMDEKMKEASRQAALLESIQEFPKGFNTLVGERGITLSGGQKQRVSIARALVKDPELLILDDCLSAVDTKTEAEILGNLKQVLRHKTAIIISHRVSTVKDADTIVVLDEGRIIERGPHSELLTAGGVYASLYYSQLRDDRKSEQLPGQLE